MNKSTSNVVAFADPSVEKDALTALIRQGAQQLLSRAPMGKECIFRLLVSISRDVLLRLSNIASVWLTRYARNPPSDDS